MLSSTTVESCQSVLFVSSDQFKQLVLHHKAAAVGLLSLTPLRVR